MSMKDILSKIEGLNPELLERITKAADDYNAGLVSKRDELMDKIKRKESPDNFAELEALKKFKEAKEIEELESRKHYEEAIKLHETKYKKEIEKLSESLKSKESAYNEMIFNSEISKKFDEIKVNPATREALSALFKQKSKQSENGFLIDEKPINDFFGEWSKSETAKPFILAPQNSGGNSQSQTAKPQDSSNLTQLINSQLGR